MDAPQACAKIRTYIFTEASCWFRPQQATRSCTTYAAIAVGVLNEQFDVAGCRWGSPGEVRISHGRAANHKFSRRGNFLLGIDQQAGQKTPGKGILNPIFTTGRPLGLDNILFTSILMFRCRSDHVWPAVNLGELANICKISQMAHLKFLQSHIFPKGYLRQTRLHKWDQKVKLRRQGSPCIVRNQQL